MKRRNHCENDELKKAKDISGASEWESREIKRLGIPAAFSDGPHGVRNRKEKRPSRIECMFRLPVSDSSYDCEQLGRIVG